MSLGLKPTRPSNVELVESFGLIFIGTLECTTPRSCHDSGALEGLTFRRGAMGHDTRSRAPTTMGSGGSIRRDHRFLAASIVPVARGARLKSSRGAACNPRHRGSQSVRASGARGAFQGGLVSLGAARRSRHGLPAFHPAMEVTLMTDPLSELPPGLKRQMEIYQTGLADNPPVQTVSAEELEEKAKAVLKTPAYDYLAGGAGSEDTMRANREAFRRWRIVPRFLRDVSRRELSVEVLGKRLPSPFLLAPVGVLSILHKEADLAVARAVRGVGVPMVLSTASSNTMESVAAALGDTLRWFQLYWPKDDELAASFLRARKRPGMARSSSRSTPAYWAGASATSGMRIFRSSSAKGWPITSATRSSSSESASIRAKTRGGRSSISSASFPARRTPGKTSAGSARRPGCRFWSKGSSARTTPAAPSITARRA